MAVTVRDATLDAAVDAAEARVSALAATGGRQIEMLAGILADLAGIHAELAQARADAERARGRRHLAALHVLVGG